MSLNTGEAIDFYVDWPGWELSENKFGDEFDRAARIRMIVGSRQLLPFLFKHISALTGSILEIGPFFNPLLTCSELNHKLPPDVNLTFLENDPHALQYLTDKGRKVLDIDLNGKDVKLKFKEEFRRCNFESAHKFNAIVLSQVLNYVDVYAIFALLKPFLATKGLLFINNVIDYGIPQLFSRNRPSSNDQIVQNVVTNGYVIYEEQCLAKIFEKEPDLRLIIVATH